MLTITNEHNMLTGQVPNIRQRELIPASLTEFVWFSPDSNVDMRISFVKNEKGQVDYAVLRSEGADMWRAKKEK